MSVDPDTLGVRLPVLLPRLRLIMVVLHVVGHLRCRVPIFIDLSEDVFSEGQVVDEFPGGADTALDDHEEVEKGS